MGVWAGQRAVALEKLGDVRGKASTWPSDDFDHRCCSIPRCDMNTWITGVPLARSGESALVGQDRP